MRKDVCPACGRYPAGSATCEYCDADLPSADLIKTWRQVAAFCVASGLLLLWYATGGPNAELVYVSDIRPSMNHALVRVEGRIVSEPFASRQLQAPAYVSFLIDDNTGLLRVCMHGEEAARFLAAKPAPGNRVQVVGSLQVRAGSEPRVYLRSLRGAEPWGLFR